MTSPGLKRPLDYSELGPGRATGGSSSHVNSAIVNNINGLSSDQHHLHHSTFASNGNKRRCTSSAQPRNHLDHLGGPNGPASLLSTGGLTGHSSSPFRDLSSPLGPLGDDIASMISEELHRSNSHRHHNSKSSDSHTIQSEILPESSPNTTPPLPSKTNEATTTSTTTTLNAPATSSQTQICLTIQQAQIICERIIRDREQKIRDEYDKILARKLAEQYDLLTKVNYLKSLESRMSPAGAAAAAAAAVSASMLPTSGNSSSISALAAAYSNMHRSVAASHNAAAVAAASSLPDISSFANGITPNGHPSALTNPQHLAYNIQQQVAAATYQAQQHQRAGAAGSVPGAVIPPGPVLLASNLDEQLATPEALFTLFGVFGDVIRVKILFNKKDNALIQMADASQAQVAQGYLDKQRVFGKIIRVTRSKHQVVQMPRDGNQSDAGLTKDFTNTPLHRFKIPGSRNYLNIYPPSSTLHISNIPATIDEDGILKAFKDNCGFEFSSFKFFPKDRKMALVRFGSIEHATIALIKMHNFQISDDNNLRVSFSKPMMQQT